jgi:hypothetical protein
MKLKLSLPLNFTVPSNYLRSLSCGLPRVRLKPGDAQSLELSFTNEDHHRRGHNYLAEMASPRRLPGSNHLPS